MGAPDTTARRQPVMADVARLAGVSHQTVSRVLNDNPHVREETRERVLSAIRELDYRPNSAARTLVDCARGWPLEDAVVAMDAALLRGSTDAARLGEAVSRAQRWLRTQAPGPIDRTTRRSGRKTPRARSRIETDPRRRRVRTALHS